MNIKNANDLFKIEINQGTDDQYIYDFIFELNQYYKKYLDKWKKENNEWNTFWNVTNQNNKSISREEEFSQSPLTILHGPWGSGKTFFIKELIKKWDTLLEELKLKFKNIIYIDLSQHFYSSTNVVLEFTEIFYEILLCFLPEEELNKKEIIKRVSKLVKYWLSQSSRIQNTKNFFSKSYKIAKNKYNPFSNKNNIRKEVEEIVKKIQPTIVVLDNIERLGNSISDIIKIIRFYSYFPNFLFILPMNKTAIKFSNLEIEEEPIEKYITLDVWFEYRQDYTNLLNNYNLGRQEICRKYGEYGFKYQYVDEINSLLRMSLKNQNNIEYNLTVRQLKKTLEKYNVDNWLTSEFSKNKYRGFLFFNKFIWKNDVLNKDIKDFIKAIEITYHSDLFKENFLNEFGTNSLVANHLNYLLKINKNFFCINFNIFKNEFDEYRKSLNDQKEILKKELNNATPFIGSAYLSNHRTTISYLETIIEKLDKEISYLEKFKSDYFEQKHEKDLSEIWKLAEEFIELKKKEDTLDQVSNFAQELENYVKEKFGYKDN